MAQHKQIQLNKLPTVFIIAEAGVNHNGSQDNAKKLIDMAHRCGADAIKFQKKNLNSDIQVTKFDDDHNNFAEESSFQRHRNILEHQDFLEFSQDKFRQLKEYADSIGIMFISSAWDEDSVDFLVDLKVPMLKVGSQDLTNFPLLEHISKKKLPLIMSTGMANLDTVIEAYEIVSFNNKNVCLLQCTSCYPTDPENINLNVLKTYQTQFPSTAIGYSGHEQGLTASLGGVALGAKIIERHITLDRNMDGPEHIASLEETEFKDLVNQIRIMEKCLGSADKQKLSCELENFQTHSKSLFFKKSIKKGEKITREHLTCSSPATGISPTEMYYVIGNTVNCDLKKGTKIINQYLELKI